MREIESIRDKKDEVFQAPDSLRRRDLRQSPANPRLDRISEHQGHAHDPRENLFQSVIVVAENRVDLPNKRGKWPCLQMSV